MPFFGDFSHFKGNLALFSLAIPGKTPFPCPSPKCVSLCYAQVFVFFSCHELCGAKHLCAGAYSLS